MFYAHWYMERDLHSAAVAAAVKRMKAKEVKRVGRKNIFGERTVVRERVTDLPAGPGYIEGYCERVPSRDWLMLRYQGEEGGPRIANGIASRAVVDEGRRQEIDEPRNWRGEQSSTKYFPVKPSQVMPENHRCSVRNRNIKNLDHEVEESPWRTVHGPTHTRSILMAVVCGPQLTPDLGQVQPFVSVCFRRSLTPNRHRLFPRPRIDSVHCTSVNTQCDMRFACYRGSSGPGPDLGTAAGAGLSPDNDRPQW